jgi:hypothetical protein
MSKEGENSFVLKIRKESGNVEISGAGATFDWMFFDNSKLIEFDD